MTADIQTLSLKEYAAALLGPGPDPADPVGSVEEHKLQWLTKRLRGEAKPQLPGYKVARQWRATEADVAQAIDMLRPPNVSVPAVPMASSMTRTSRRRLASA
jgi:hypothetical protein